MANNKYPDLIVRKGIGTFFSGDIEFKASFEITHYPQNIIIETELENSIILLSAILTNDKWRLEGIVDQNIFMTVDNLALTKNAGSKLNFEPFQEVKFGDISLNIFNRAEFPIIGFYEGKIELNQNGWHISSDGNNKESALKKKKGNLWNLQLEGITLKLIKDGATEDEFVSKINDITLLLSLAVGNDIIFNRQLFFNKDNLLLEIWRRKAGYYFGVEPCIPDFEINHFLEKSLGAFEMWSKKKKDVFYIIVNYINSSSQGFLEDRLLRLCIAWENLATKWGKGNNLSKIELNLLKEFLRKSIDSFEVPENYDKEFIKDRILKALDWEKLYNSLINLVNQYQLNYDKLRLDFKALIKIRNDIAHSGKFRKKYSKDYLADLIYYNKLGLQIILLRELGYDNLIEFQKDRWVTRIKIDELLKQNQSIRTRL